MARSTRFRLREMPSFGLMFLTLLIGYGYVLPRWADWNQNSRFDLTRALVERHTVAIDAFAANTGDYAIVQGRTVSDKAPGLSLMAVPPYALYHLAAQVPSVSRLINAVAHRGAFADTLNPAGTHLDGDKAETALALAFVTFVCVALPTALLGVLLLALVCRVSPYCRVNAMVVTILMLATPLTPYGNAFYGHVPAAILLFLAFAILLALPNWRTPRWLIMLGALLGATLVMEYPAALIVAGIGVWVLTRLWQARKLAELGWVALGSAPFLALLTWYDTRAYGTLLPTGYTHSTLWQDRHSEGFLSLTYPKPDALWGATFGDFRGLFYLSPVLLLAVPGFIVWWRTKRERGAWWVCLWAVVVMLLFDASSAMWWGGFAVGLRYVLPMLPFCLYPIGWLIPILVRNRGATLAATALAACSLVLVWSETLAGQGYPPDTVAHPLTEYAWPHLRTGDVARNVGMAFGLHGLWSMLPLVAVLLGISVIGQGVEVIRNARAVRGYVPATREAEYVRS